MSEKKLSWWCKHRRALVELNSKFAAVHNPRNNVLGLPITAISTVFEFVDKSNLLSYSLYYAKACNEFAGPIFASLHLGNTAPFEEMLQQW